MRQRIIKGIPPTIILFVFEEGLRMVIPTIPWLGYFLIVLAIFWVTLLWWSYVKRLTLWLRTVVFRYFENKFWLLLRKTRLSHHPIPGYGDAQGWFRSRELTINDLLSQIEELKKKTNKSEWYLNDTTTNHKLVSGKAAWENNYK
jgi:hypothetical protein